MAQLFNNNSYHPRQPNANAWVNFDGCSRPDSRSQAVTYTFSFGVTINNGYYGASHSTGFQFEIDGAENTGYIVGNGGSSSISFSRNNASTNGVVGLTIRVWHHQGTNANPTGGNNCSHGYATYVWSGTIGIPAYNPYSPPSISISSVKSVAQGGDIITPGQSLSVTYKINRGTNAISYTNVNLFDKNKSYTGQRIQFSGDNYNTQTKTVTFTGLTAGTQYYVMVSCGDTAGTDVQSGYIAFYTYTEPKISSTLSMSTSSPQNAITANTFTATSINRRVWSGKENDFYYQYRVVDGNGNARSSSDVYRNYQTLTDATVSYTNSNLVWARTAAQIRTLIPKAYDGKTNKIQIRAVSGSPEPDWVSTNTATASLIVYYRPRQQITSVTLKQNNSTGTGITQGGVVTNTSTLSGIYVDWSSYNMNAVNAGYTQGFRIRLYDYNKNIVKTYYTANKYYTIPKTDIPRINATYIDITPYFANDTTNTSNYWYYNAATITLYNFVKLVTELPKPVIDYPVKNSNWINYDFRICFTLPEDADYSYVTESYRYENIEIKINNNYIIRITDSTSTTSGGTKNDTIFNALTTNLTHKRPIVIWPNKISGLPQTSSYSVQVRVKKKYGTTTSEPRWSSWSDVRTFKVTIPLYDVNKLDLIMASHYNNTLDTVDRIQKTYNVGWEGIPNPAIARSTVILASQYSQANLLGKLNETKNKVNNYGTFDTGRTDIKFDSTDQLPSTFDETVGEYITALKDDNDVPGRNYIRYAYDRFLLLK